MISALVALAAIMWLMRSFIGNRAFFLVAIFLTWQFALKVFGVVFLDNFGPVYSDEVYTEVGGLGSSAPLMILFVFIPLAVLKLAMSRFSAHRPPPMEPRLAWGGFTLGDFFCYVFLAFLVCLYVDLVRIGTIPLFAKIERFEYQGGIFHQLLLNYLFLIAFIIGYVVARGRMLTGLWDLRYVAIVMALFIYLFLTGHRFGSFYILVTFALVPAAALFVAPRIGMSLAQPVRNTSLLQRLAASRVAVSVFAFVLGSIVLVAMFNSLLYVRDGDVQEALLQRFLVQPVHLYWLTWESVRLGDVVDSSAAMDFMFNDPFDATRNTGIQYLMYRHLGATRASRIYEGQQVDYAGGYPEILIEMGGVGFAILASVIAAGCVALLYRTCVVAVCRGWFFTALMSIYVCFGFINLFLGGMINFLTAYSFWIKVSALILVLATEWLLDKRGRRLLPWVLLRRGKIAVGG